jgi:hypothetical protein
MKHYVAGVVVARITSQIVQTVFDVQLADWQKASLLFPSIVRVHKVATFEKRLVDRALGKLTRRDWAQVRKAVRHLWTSVYYYPLIVVIRAELYMIRSRNEFHR